MTMKMISNRFSSFEDLFTENCWSIIVFNIRLNMEKIICRQKQKRSEKLEPFDSRHK